MTPRPAPASAPPRRLTITLLGFSSGLPLALTASTLTVRLAESGVNKATIGLFAGVSLAYAFKFLGAPFVDALKLPVLTRLLGRRRSWMAVTQTALIAALLVLAQAPAAAPSFIGLCAVAVAVLSALQDIAIDAWRVERLTPEEQGMGGTYAVLGYRLGMLASSVGALHLASVADWRLTYSAMAALMGVGLGTTLCCREPAVPEAGEALRQRGRMGEWLEQSVIGPLQEFFSRPGGWALPLLLIFSYKLSDAFIGIMTNPFYLETGFTKVQIADIAKLYGIVTTILAGFAGGWMVRRCGVFLPLALGS
ncbi:MAG: MFS transporter, partial [Alphaproteobacteria bacterium]|nr:MFS transporter [Alphaproteobacteria bacterium]